MRHIPVSCWRLVTFSAIFSVTLLGCGIPNLGGLLPRTPDISVITSLVEVTAYNQADPDLDPNMTLVIAYKVYRSDNFGGAQNAYEETIEVLSNNLSETTRVDSYNSTWMRKFPNNLISVNTEELELTFSVSVDEEFLSLSENSKLVENLTVDISSEISGMAVNEEFYVGFFAYAKTIDAGNLEPRYSLIDSHLSSKLFVFSKQ